MHPFGNTYVNILSVCCDYLKSAIVLPVVLSLVPGCFSSDIICLSVDFFQSASRKDVHDLRNT